MPGGPRISIPYSAAIAVMRSTSGGPSGGGGSVSDSAGSPTVRVKSSKPARSVPSRNRASGDVTLNVCGMPSGANTKLPLGATITSPPTQNVSSPSST